MPFEHNDHYHRLLLRHLPRECGAALDVGCGTGRFARRVAGLGIEVDAIDSSAEAIEEARVLTTQMAGDRIPRFRYANVAEIQLPKGRYDFISCLASIHHMPFGTVAALRDALAPGGVLVILGCYPEKTWLDWAWSLVAVPVNAAARLTAHVKDKLLRPTTAASGRVQMRAPVSRPTVPLPRIRQEAAVLLPGSRIRRLLFWRYLLVFRNSG
ncbi:class I SAM-dependent methyltransferase [Streptomyces sp. NPDC048416]|uniref:class I SAM-dependent methyltransferase n=1 Tax=Streptomyces sp. NPDC048416 TaxID=3365546 RepID=UPI003712B320